LLSLSQPDSQIAKLEPTPYSTDNFETFISRPQVTDFNHLDNKEILQAHFAELPVQINSRSFYDLLMRLHSSDQLKMRDDDLKGEFWMSSKEVGTLIQSDESSSCSSSGVFVKSASLGPDSCVLNHQQALPAQECQELCCLLNFTPLEDCQI
jgi:hypothetical protein